MTDHQKDSAELANEQGFIGTFTGFIDWLRDALTYGSLRVFEKAPDDMGTPVTTLKTATGGYSSDETLLGRLRHAMWPNVAWVRSERGGLTVYEFPEWLTDSAEEREWLAPDDGTFERIYRARTLRVLGGDGVATEFAFAGGVELAYTEPDRDILAPAGVLTVRPAPPLEPLLGNSSSTEDGAL